MMQTINQANVRMDGKCTILHPKHSKVKLSLLALMQVGIVFLFFNSTSCSKASYNEHKNKQPSSLIKHLSVKEHNNLALFFYNLFAQEELGYTFFGDKPMSFCFPNTHPPVFSKRDYLFKLYIEGTIQFANGLAAWDKLKELSDNSDYSLVIYEEKKYPIFAILINKPAFIKEVSTNIDAFKSVYGRSVDALWVLKNIEKNVITQDELFSQHLLLGIMLGYGRHAAELFERRWNLEYGEFRPPLFQNQQTPRKDFFSLEEELQYLIQRLQAQPKTFEWYTNTFPPFLRVTTVAFAFDPDDPEAQALIKKYKKL